MCTARLTFKPKLIVASDKILTVTIKYCSNILDKTGLIEIPLKSSMVRDLLYPLAEDVIIELLKAKCFPALYYGLEACPACKKVSNQIFRICAKQYLQKDLRYKIIRCRN